MKKLDIESLSRLHETHRSPLRPPSLPFPSLAPALTITILVATHFNQYLDRKKFDEE